MFRKILIIINPVAGADEPILSIIQRKLQPTNIIWEICVTQKKEDINKYVKKAIRKNVDAVAVYGGDGTVTQTAELLYKYPIPLIILPGGTANILAKELNIPLYAEEMLGLVASKKIKLKKIDMGIINKKPFLLRVSYGLLADMIIETDSDLKKTIGQFAYGVSVIKKLTESKPVTYTITIDKKKIITEGISLVLANSANMGMTGLSALKEVDMSDGNLNLL
jgi:diacylglycerol kinase family enzyme